MITSSNSARHEHPGLALYDPAQSVPHSVRKRRREVEDPDGGIAARLSVLPEQDGYLAVQDLKAALTHLAVEQR